MKKFLTILAAITLGGLLLMGGCLALVGGTANEVAKDLEKDTTGGKVSAEEVPGANGDGERWAWEDLKVRKDDLDFFSGAVTVTNKTDEAQEVYVEVTAYDGEQTLGALNGSTRVKPGATTKVDLTSLDEFAKASDFEVEVTGLL